MKKIEALGSNIYSFNPNFIAYKMVLKSYLTSLVPFSPHRLIINKIIVRTAW